jgi:4,4'-diaponeurosporenoate glycosyltransferase
VIGPLVAAGWVAGWLVAGPVRRLPRARAPVSTITVVVPARDEALRLPRLLAALGADESVSAAREIVVVDDGSRDGSGNAAREAGATVITTEPPPGWTGKAWACWQGAAVARGEVLVFLDADTEPGTGFVDRLAAAAAAAGGMVSVQPTHRVERLYERASAVANVVALMAGTGPACAKRGWWRGPVGFGPAMAVPRDVYLAAGGHRLVHDEVAEDVALAHALADRGIAVSAFADAGGGEVEYRMYPDGLRPLVQGWTKNLAAGASKIPPVRALLVAVWITAAISAVAAMPSRPLGYASFAGQFAVLFRRAGRFGAITAAAYPLPLFTFVALFARSAFGRATKRPAAWRGRWVTP